MSSDRSRRAEADTDTVMLKLKLSYPPTSLGSFTSISTTCSLLSGHRGSWNLSVSVGDVRGEQLARCTFVEQTAHPFLGMRCRSMPSGTWLNGRPPASPRRFRSSFRGNTTRRGSTLINALVPNTRYNRTSRVLSVLQLHILSPYASNDTLLLTSKANGLFSTDRRKRQSKRHERSNTFQ